MNLRIIGTVAILVGLLAAVQIAGLERSPEQKLEHETQNLEDLKTSSILPTYIGSLFLGSFRAVAVDVLWIQLSRMRQQEHRYFETLEIMDMISKLQPRNPEVWANQAWDCAYNIANQFATKDEENEKRAIEALLDPSNPTPPPANVIARYRQRRDSLARLISEKKPQWEKWIKAGIQNLLTGVKHLPEDPYLKHQIAFTLWRKPTVNDGEFDREFLRFIESDRDLQSGLSLGMPPSREPLTAFEFAEHWFGLAKANIEKLRDERRFQFYRGLADRLTQGDLRDDTYAHTQLGLNLHPDSMDGFRYWSRYHQSFYRWLQGATLEERCRETKDPAGLEESRKLLDAARQSFHLASIRAADVRRLYSGMSSLFEVYTKFNLLLETAVDHELKARAGGGVISTGDLLREFTAARDYLLKEKTASADGGFVLNAMSHLKMVLTGDQNEYNDDAFAATFLGRQPCRGLIGPDLSDLDYFVIPPPRRKDDGLPPPPRKVAVSVTRRGALDLTVTLQGSDGTRNQEMGRFDLTAGEPTKSIEVTSRLAILVIVRAKEGATELPPDASYEIRSESR